MIHVAELIGRVSVTRPPSDRLSAAGDAPGSIGFPLEHIERVVPATPPEAAPTIHAAAAPPAPVDPRLIADLVYRLMRDDLAISRERA